MNQEEQKIPKIFISYSHDSPDHKKWVAGLAVKLVENGVDVFFDQWDLSFGDDVPKYMEKAVTESDRVLMICTEIYVRKADSGEGGVGYEAMIVTGELVSDLGTSKFIPVIRQKPGSTLKPKSVSTRYHIDLSADINFDEECEALLRELHQVPVMTKPKIGKSPFARTPSGEETPVDAKAPSAEIVKIDNLGNVSIVYKTALTVARDGDIVSWRRIINEARMHIAGRLIQWRNKHVGNIQQSINDLPQMVLDGLSVYAALFSIALAGVESGRKKFNKQVSIMDEILFPKDWDQSGYSIIGAFPETAAFFFQALHGAACMLTDQLHLAIDLVRTTIESSSYSESIPLWQRHEIMGWPISLGRRSRLSWDLLSNLFQSMPWMAELFSSEEEYQESLCAYYMALNILEYVETIASGHEDVFLENRPQLDIPVHFLRMQSTIKRRAYRLLINDAEQIKNIWEHRKIEDNRIKEHWGNWIRICASWTRDSVPHKRLIDDIFGD